MSSNRYNDKFYERVSMKIADDQNDAILSGTVGHRVKKTEEKLLVPVVRGEGRRERSAGVRKILVDGERQGESGLPSRESSPSKELRAAFHAHFINSNLSPAENWIRLIPVIDAGLRSRIL